MCPSFIKKNLPVKSYEDSHCMSPITYYSRGKGQPSLCRVGSLYSMTSYWAQVVLREWSWPWKRDAATTNDSGLGWACWSVQQLVSKDSMLLLPAMRHCLDKDTVSPQTDLGGVFSRQLSTQRHSLTPNRLRYSILKTKVNYHSLGTWI